MMVGYGLGELLIVFVVGLLSIGLPVVVIVLLVMLYKKAQSIEELLKGKK
jgi:chromate transport protein ChrA